ncbi:MAG: class I SAM-dependent methyltransferase [Patescibacteria group bacterium]
MSRLIKHRTNCRICGHTKLKLVLAFGQTPLANAFLSQEQLHAPELFFPLNVFLCQRCGLVQLQDVVLPKLMFAEYVYASSTSPVFQAHFESLAAQVTERFALNANSLVIDIGSNDGILLAPFKRHGVKVLGVDPARAVAKLARRAGIPTEVAFFSGAYAARLRRKVGAADIVTATNVFAHVDDLADITAGVKYLLKPDGVFIVEVPYLVDFLQQNIFDTVYHEHLSYFSVAALNTFFKLHGLRIFDAQKISTHGGSIRLYVKFASAKHKIQSAVQEFLRSESSLGLKSIRLYTEYAARIQQNKLDLLILLTNLKQAGKKIAAYGAPAKGNTLLNVFGIGPDLLDYIVDDSPLKQGKYSPGRHIPVVSSQALKRQPPDYLLILAWNFAQPIMDKNQAFKQAGGKFILPIPKPKVV